MKKIVLIPQDIKSVTPNACINLIFKNENDVLSVIDNVEDIIKANTWFNAIPQNAFICEYGIVDKNEVYYYENKIHLNDGESLKGWKIISTTTLEQRLEYVKLQGECFIDENDKIVPISDKAEAVRFVEWLLDKKYLPLGGKESIQQLYSTFIKNI
jgi:hypothetical protein